MIDDSAKMAFRIEIQLYQAGYENIGDEDMGDEAERIFYINFINCRVFY